jgi:DNA repair protein RadC
MLVRDARSSYGEPLRTSGEVANLLQAEADTWDREHFLVLALNGKNRLLGVETVSIGTLTASLVHPREVFTSLILAKAAAFILAHNHPSGDPTPSIEDHSITRRLKECGELFGLGLLDHVVLGHERYFSMADQGVL